MRGGEGVGHSGTAAGRGRLGEWNADVGQQLQGKQKMWLDVDLSRAPRKSISRFCPPRPIKCHASLNLTLLPMFVLRQPRISKHGDSRMGSIYAAVGVLVVARSFFIFSFCRFFDNSHISFCYILGFPQPCSFLCYQQ